MEDARPKLVESNSLFQPHRRSHLRSETCRTLVRILSPFCGNADVSLATNFDPQQLRAAYSNYLRQETVESSGQQVGGDSVRAATGDSAIEKVTVVEDGLRNNSLEDGCFHDSEVKVDVVKDTAIVEKSDNVSDEREHPRASCQDNHYVHEENHRDELDAEHMVEGNKVLVVDNNSSNIIVSGQTFCGNDQISPKKFQEETVEPQQVMAEEDAASIVQKLSGTIFPIDGDEIGEAFKLKENKNILSTMDTGMDQWPKHQPKESKPEGKVCEPDLEIERSHVSSFEVMEVEDDERCCEKVLGANPSYLDSEIPCSADDQSKKNEDKAITMEVDASKVEHKMLSEDMEMDKCLIENQDMEEGEIFGDSTYEIPEDLAVLAEKVVDNQTSEGTMNRNKIPSVQADGEANEPIFLLSGTAEHASHENREDSKQNESSLDACKRGSIVSEKMVISTNELQNDFMFEETEYTAKSGRQKDVDSFTARVSNHVIHGQVPNELAAGQREVFSTEKTTGVCNKKKRGPLSEGRKERKKIMKRKKQAEKNRKLGVKRLKLHPVTVPKPVVYCRHYVKGRCHEGDKCKFSHDTTPLTKSTPCSYYARHSCMKGDDCPFDHQLSKYPCSNFVSKGSCSRGESCLFSHKILPQGESTSTPNLKNEAKPPLVLDSLDSQKKSNISGGKQKLVTLGGSLPQKMTRPPPAGISFLSFGKSSDHSSQVKNDDVECRNLLARSPLCSVETSNEILRKKIQPETVPKGINFLSFGRTSLKSNSEKLATPSSYNDANIPSCNQIQTFSKTVNDSSVLLEKVQMITPKATNFLSLIGKSNSEKLGTPSSYNDANIPSGNQIQTVSKTVNDSSVLLEKAQMITSKATNFSSPVGNHASNEFISLSSNSKAGSDLSVRIKGNMHDKHEGLSAILSGLRGTPITSGQSSDTLASSMNKGTPNSAQKALLSTLAFAAKYESSMNKSIPSASASSNEGNKESRNENTSGTLKNDSAKASKLLDFLLAVGSKSNLKQER